MPLLPLSIEVWFLVLLSFLVSSLSFYYFDLYELKLFKKKYFNSENKFVRDLFNTFAVFTQQSIAYFPLNNMKMQGKFVLGTMLLYCILLSIMYSSGLASNLAVPRYAGAIKTANDLAFGNKKWAGSQIGAWVNSIKGDNNPVFKLITNKIIEANASETVDLINKREAGVAIERLQGRNFAIPDYIDKDVMEKLRIMDEDLYYELCITMARKNSVLLPYLNRLITRARETGLPYIWETMVRTFSRIY